MTNVVFILTDDQGPWAARCCGNPEIITPNLDRLAATGTRFENFFVATPVCSPSRATFLTGRIPSQHGVHDYLGWNVGHASGPHAIRFMDGELGYTDLMARQGYTCGLAGKWHLGDNLIPQCGFTDWFITHNGAYHNSQVVRGGQIVREPRYISDVTTDEALALLDKYAARAHPFYLGVHYTAPHSPWKDQPQDLLDLYKDCDFASCPQEPMHPDAHDQTRENLGQRASLAGYFAAVTGMDRGVGRILDRLEALGLREQTLVVFASDNGFSCGHHGFWGKGNGTQPRNMYENSVKVPAIFSQPGRIPAGRVERAMVSAYDFMPTLLEYVGLAPAPADRNLPGRSFLPALEGRPLGERESVVVFDEYGPVRMIRTKEWKFVFRHSFGPHQLFDLVNDPGERHNLAHEPGQRARLSELKAQMDAWFDRYVIPSRDGLRLDGTARSQERLIR